MSKKNTFQDFMTNLNGQDRDKVQSFLKSYAFHMDIESHERKKIQADARNALMYYVGNGLSLDEAMHRLSAENLGGFYAHEALSWYPLDDAAKIYPLSMKFGQMPMFRLSCYLKQPVVPEILQIALDFTIKRFPSFATVVRKGFFWHYLDSIKRRFPVTQEKSAPCQPLKVTSVGAQSFKVSYYGNRVSVEFFHVLTDGHGGTLFLRTLIAEYLHLLGAPVIKGEGVLDISEPARVTELSNDFERFCPHSKKSGGFAGPAALQMGGKIAKHAPCKVVQLGYDTKTLLDKAHSLGVSVTTLILTLMFLAQRSATEVVKGTIQMQVPVDMRKFFESDTVRNFSMYCSIDIPVSELDSFDKTVENVAQQLKQKATYEEMSVMMSTAHKLVRSLRFIPLAIKAPVAKVIYGFLGDSRFSNTLSNLGNIKVPEAMEPYIEGFDFILGTCVVSRASCSMCSYGGTTVLSISKNTKDPSFEERLVTISREIGLELTVSGTPLYE